MQNAEIVNSTKNIDNKLTADFLPNHAKMVSTENIMLNINWNFIIVKNASNVMPIFSNINQVEIFGAIPAIKIVKKDNMLLENKEGITSLQSLVKFSDFGGLYISILMMSNV